MNLKNGSEELNAWVISLPPDWTLATTVWGAEPLEISMPCFETTCGGIFLVSGCVLMGCYRSWWRMPLRAAARREDLQLLERSLKEVDDEADLYEPHRR
jgi:hypothetical protein